MEEINLYVVQLGDGRYLALDPWDDWFSLVKDWKEAKQYTDRQEAMNDAAVARSTEYRILSCGVLWEPRKETI